MLAAFSIPQGLRRAAALISSFLDWKSKSKHKTEKPPRGPPLTSLWRSVILCHCSHQGTQKPIFVRSSGTNSTASWRPTSWSSEGLPFGLRRTPKENDLTSVPRIGTAHWSPFWGSLVGGVAWDVFRRASVGLEELRGIYKCFYLSDWASMQLCRLFGGSWVCMQDFLSGLFSSREHSWWDCCSGHSSQCILCTLEQRLAIRGKSQKSTHSLPKVHLKESCF